MHITNAARLHFAAVVDSSDDAIITESIEGVIETWNRAAERMFGYAASEALGESIHLILPFEDRADEQDARDQLSSGNRTSHFETVAQAKDGTRLSISVAMSPILTPDGQMVGISRIVREISRQKTLERGLSHLAAIVDSSEDAIVSKNLDGIVQTWNKAAERMFGYTAAEMIGQPIWRIIPADRRAEEDDVLSRIRSGRSIEHFETVRQRKDGSRVEISLSVSPIKDRHGKIIGASKIARDITMQRRLTRAAEEANRVKDEFLAMLSHELRTPLNAVLGYTRMLRTGQLGDGGQEHAMEVIERNAHVISQLVSDLLDVSSIVTGKIRLKVTECDLVGLIAAAVDIVRPSAVAKGVTLRVDLPDMPVPTQCDPDRLQQAFWNLLSNAVKFTPRGGSVAVRLARQDSITEITVADTGIGIRREQLPYVFQRFWQGESMNHRHPGGLGLGLALARHFVELHGGTIAAASEGEGHGATFTVHLPLSLVAAEEGKRESELRL